MITRRCRSFTPFARGSYHGMTAESYFARRLDYWPMAELIHHTNESADGGVSPFDTAIRGIVAGEDVLIACPYITLEYLESILERAASWRLLTDAEAWLDSYSTTEREAIREFVARHHDRIHDVRDLHAKAVVGETGALVGSANLTRMGVSGRDELAVRFDEPERIAELCGWFDELWEEGSRVKLDEIDERIRTSSPMPSSARGGGGMSISSDARRVSASVLESDTSKLDRLVADADSDDVHERLVERVGKAPNRDWIDSHFDLFEELLDVSGLTTDDPILVASIPKTGGIHITINNRYVLTMMRTSRSQTSFILSDDTSGLDGFISRTTEYDQFSNASGEPAPHLLTFVDGLKQVADPSFRRGCIQAILSEVENRADRAKWRDKHEPIVCQAAVDHEYGAQVIDEAFSE